MENLTTCSSENIEKDALRAIRHEIKILEQLFVNKLESKSTLNVALSIKLLIQLLHICNDNYTGPYWFDTNLEIWQIHLLKNCNPITEDEEFTSTVSNWIGLENINKEDKPEIFDAYVICRLLQNLKDKNIKKERRRTRQKQERRGTVCVIDNKEFLLRTPFIETKDPIEPNVESIDISIKEFNNIILSKLGRSRFLHRIYFVFNIKGDLDSINNIAEDYRKMITKHNEDVEFEFRLTGSLVLNELGIILVLIEGTEYDLARHFVELGSIYNDEKFDRGKILLIRPHILCRYVDNFFVLKGSSDEGFEWTGMEDLEDEYNSQQQEIPKKMHFANDNLLKKLNRLLIILEEMKNCAEEEDDDPFKEKIKLEDVQDVNIVTTEEPTETEDETVTEVGDPFDRYNYFMGEEYSEGNVMQTGRDSNEENQFFMLSQLFNELGGEGPDYDLADDDMLRKTSSELILEASRRKRIKSIALLEPFKQEEDDDTDVNVMTIEKWMKRQDQAKENLSPDRDTLEDEERTKDDYKDKENIETTTPTLSEIITYLQTKESNILEVNAFLEEFLNITSLEKDIEILRTNKLKEAELKEKRKRLNYLKNRNTIAGTELCRYIIDRMDYFTISYLADANWESGVVYSLDDDEEVIQNSLPSLKALHIALGYEKLLNLKDYCQELDPRVSPPLQLENNKGLIAENLANIIPVSIDYQTSDLYTTFKKKLFFFFKKTRKSSLANDPKYSSSFLFDGKNVFANLKSKLENSNLETSQKSSDPSVFNILNESSYLHSFENVLNVKLPTVEDVEESYSNSLEPLNSLAEFKKEVDTIHELTINILKNKQF